MFFFYIPGFSGKKFFFCLICVLVELSVRARLYLALKGFLSFPHVIISAHCEDQQLEVIKVDCNHSHELSNHRFQSHPQNRRITNQEKNYALPLMELNVLPSMIAQKLNDRTGKICFHC